MVVLRVTHSVVKVVTNVSETDKQGKNNKKIPLIVHLSMANTGFYIPTCNYLLAIIPTIDEIAIRSGAKIPTSVWYESPPKTTRIMKFVSIIAWYPL